MRRSPFALACLVALLLSTAGPARACSCAQLTPEEKGDAADVVFTGPVRDVRQRHDGMVVARFRVRTLYKGRVRPKVNVATAPDGAACGCTFRVGRRYTVFASRLGEGDGLATNICSGTRRGPIDPHRYGLPPGTSP